LERTHAQRALAEKFANLLPAEEFELCLASLSDYKATWVMASRPIEMLLHYLKQYFNPNQEHQGPYSSLQVCFRH
jgi:hypothetical protein